MSECAPGEAADRPGVPDPSEQEILLLRTVLSPPEEAARAWARWAGASAEAGWLEALSPYRRIWPLLLCSAVQSRLPVPAPVLTAFKAAYVSEKVRHAHLWRLLERCVRRLTDAGLPTVLVGGAALAETVYPEPALRHAHAIRLGVPAVNRASECLADLGLRPTDTERPPGAGPVLLEGTCREALVLEPVEGRVATMAVAGSGVVVQPPGDALTAAWDETLAPRAHPLVWAFDLHFAAQRDPAWVRLSDDRRVRRAASLVARVLGADAPAA